MQLQFATAQWTEIPFIWLIKIRSVHCSIAHDLKLAFWGLGNTFFIFDALIALILCTTSEIVFAEYKHV